MSLVNVIQKPNIIAHPFILREMLSGIGLNVFKALSTYKQETTENDYKKKDAAK